MVMLFVMMVVTFAVRLREQLIEKLTWGGSVKLGQVPDPHRGRLRATIWRIRLWRERPPPALSCGRYSGCPHRAASYRGGGDRGALDGPGRSRAARSALCSDSLAPTRSISITNNLVAWLVGTATSASGSCAHHSSICSLLQVASLNPFVVYGDFAFFSFPLIISARGRQGKTGNPYSSASVRAHCRTLTRPPNRESGSATARNRWRTRTRHDDPDGRVAATAASACDRS